MAEHVRYNSWYISLSSSAKQLRENEQILRCQENVNHDGQFLRFTFRSLRCVFIFSFERNKLNDYYFMPPASEDLRYNLRGISF